MRPHIRYAFLGVLLGLGAPLGSLAWSMFMRPHGGLISTLIFEWHSASYYYLYMTIGTVIAFSLFGYVLGQRNETLGELSITDGLTGVYNHRHLQEQLDREIERSDRYATPVTCLMLDIDDFKKVNDKYGHPYGDQVLVETTRILTTTVRRTDMVGRYGGEEFLVIMPNTNAEAAYPIAQRIVSSMRDHDFVFKGIVCQRITVSIGLATYPFPEHGVKTKNSVLSAADQALYKAKSAGKNQTVVWRP
jgi:diguanylate cyclase (GGDEF)-like protein